MRAENITLDPVTNGRTSKLLADVKRWCKANRVTQTDLAKELGVSTSLITEWFHGRKFPVGEQTLHLLELLRTKPKSR
jgi:transcriptional regulator with XRE-family HTH domain